MARVHVASVRRAVIDPVPPPLFTALGEAMDVIRSALAPGDEGGHPAVAREAEALEADGRQVRRPTGAVRRASGA